MCADVGTSSVFRACSPFCGRFTGLGVSRQLPAFNQMTAIDRMLCFIVLPLLIFREDGFLSMTIDLLGIRRAVRIVDRDLNDAAQTRISGAMKSPNVSGVISARHLFGFYTSVYCCCSAATKSPSQGGLAWTTLLIPQNPHNIRLTKWLQDKLWCPDAMR